MDDLELALQEMEKRCEAATKGLTGDAVIAKCGPMQSGNSASTLNTEP